MPKSIGKPVWPYPEETKMTAHPNGSWCKRIKGTLYYFGPWNDPDKALKTYLASRNDLRAGIGKHSARRSYGVSVGDLADLWLHDREQARDSGEIQPRTFNDYSVVAQVVIDILGDLVADELTPRDWTRLRRQLARRYSTIALKARMIWIRQMFQWGVRHHYIRTPEWDDVFNPPTKADVRRHRRTRRKRTHDAATIRAMIEMARPPLQAMIYLGINGGFGNTDVSMLDVDALNLKGGVIDYHRIKTGVRRTVPLWPETIESMRSIVGRRRKGPVFVTRHGHRYVHDKTDGVALAFGRVARRLGVKSSFYDLRHTFLTVARETGDLDACARIMGHEIGGGDISSVYVEDIPVERLRRVVDHVRHWLIA